MKALSISFALVYGLGMRVCGSDDTPPAPPPPAPLAAQAPAAANTEPPPAPPKEAPPREAQHGGTVVVVGESTVEVVSHASGEIEAYVLGAAPPAEAELRVEIPVVRGPAQSVTLQWDAQRGHFHGRVRDVVIVPGPLVVHLVFGANVWVGHVTTFVIAPAVVVVEEHHHHKHKKHRKHHKHKRHH